MTPSPWRCGPRPSSSSPGVMRCARGVSERIEAGRSQANADLVAGRDRVRVRVHATLHEPTGHGLVEQEKLHLGFTVSRALAASAPSCERHDAWPSDPICASRAMGPRSARVNRLPAQWVVSGSEHLEAQDLCRLQNASARSDREMLEPSGPVRRDADPEFPYRIPLHASRRTQDVAWSFHRFSTATAGWHVVSPILRTNADRQVLVSPVLRGSSARIPVSRPGCHRSPVMTGVDHRQTAANGPNAAP